MAYTAAHSLWDSVGNTPLLKIKSLSSLSGCEIFGKAEFMNPGGSIKDRAAKGIIQNAEQNGLLKKGDSIVEGTAGNTGIGLAMLGRERGYKVIVYMPNNQADEKYRFLQALGADVIAVPPCPFANENHFYHQARKYSESHPNTFWANQFENLANSQIHFETTGPEIWEQMEGRIDVLALAVGTGGTLGGTSDFLKQKNPNLEVVLIDPMGSGLYQHFHKGTIGAEGSSVTEGIGIMRLTENFKRAKIDSAIRIDDQKMISMLMHLAKEDSLFVGTSGALNAMGSLEIALKYRNSGKRIVTFLCDHGSRYQSKILNSAWLAEKVLHAKDLSSFI